MRILKLEVQVLLKASGTQSDSTASWVVPRWCPGVPIATIITPLLLGCTGGAQVAQVVHKLDQN